MGGGVWTLGEEDVTQGGVVWGMKRMYMKFGGQQKHSSWS